MSEQTATEPTLTTMALTVCSLCAGGAGGECHVPGCAFWMNRAPDMQLRNEAEEINSALADAAEEFLRQMDALENSRPAQSWFALKDALAAFRCASTDSGPS